MLQKRALPRPLRRLAAYHLENFFCIYKKRLARLRDATHVR